MVALFVYVSEWYACLCVYVCMRKREECVYIGTQVHSCRCVCRYGNMCVYLSVEAGSSTLGVIPQEISRLLFETVSH